MLKHFGSSFIIIITGLAFFAPVLFPYDFNMMDLSKSLEGPSLKHWFGLDEYGQDLFIKIIYGAKISLSVTFLALFISFSIGLVLGFLAGFFESYLEAIIMALADVVLAFPKFLLALALLAMMGSSLGHLIFALCFSTWAGFARLIRAEVKYLKQKEFVWSAKSYGASVFLQMTKHIFPNLLAVLSVHAMFQSAAILITESGLNFLGLGSSFDAPSWGGLLNSARAYLLEAPHLIFFPSLFLFLFLLSLNFVAEALRSYFDAYKC